MVNVDDAARPTGDKSGRQDLHVAREHDHVDVCLAQQSLLSRLGGAFVVGINRNVLEADTEVPGDGTQVIVIRNNQYQIAAQLPQLMGQHQIVKAMGGTAGEYRDARPPIRVAEIERQTEPAFQIDQACINPLSIQLKPRQIPNQAHEEQAGLQLGMLIGIDDVASVAKHEIR